MANNALQTLAVRFPLAPTTDHLSKFDQLFHNVYYLLQQGAGTDSILSCEIVCIQNKLNFYLTASKANSSTIMNMVYSIFPD